MKKTALTVVLLILLAGVLLTQISRLKPPPPTKEVLSLSFGTYVSAVRGFKRIQLAEVDSVEVIERTSAFSVFWDLVKFPDIVVQARVPVKYVYYVDLDEAFGIELEGNRLIVKAPALRAGAPAADVSGISYEVKQGSVFRNRQVAFEELRKTITPILQQSAQKNQGLAREEARAQLASLVKTWTSQSSDLKGQTYEVEIRFADEPAKPSAP